MKNWWLVISVVVALGAPGCKDKNLANSGCREDKDCGNPAEAFRCETQTGVCYCRTNDACAPREFCNAAGFCQDRAGCEKNEDCLDPSLFCDTTTGTCLLNGRCSIDLQCPLGNICDTAKSTCVPGCRSNGDCAGSSCRCGEVPCVCTGTTPGDVAKCAVGVCDPNFCSDNTFCRFGEQCGVQADAGVSRNQCYNDYDDSVRPYCANCVTGGGVQTCGTGANYCLIDTQNPGNYFCGSDCSGGETCPRGYACSDVIVVSTQWACTRAAPACPANQQLPCTLDTDCKRGGTCARASGAAAGFCVGQCALDEGDSTGFCTCQVDADCAQETCSAGECTISRKKCVTETDCRPIRCVDFNGVGGCLIGQNCAPSNGLSCVQVGNQ